MKILRLIIFFVVLVVFFNFVFVFKKIDCEAEGVLIESGVCESINQNFKGRSLFFTDLENDEIWNELLISQQYSQVYQFKKIKKSLSGEVKLLLLTKLPDYRLIIGQDRYLINQNNKLKDNQEKLLLPSIEYLGDQNIREHEYLRDDYHQKFLALSKALKKYDINTNKIVWQSDQEIHLFLKETEVIIDDLKDFDFQIERLSVVLKEDKLQAVLPNKKVLDMRFNLPVLK